MADPRRTLLLLAALRSRVRWRSSAGVTQSAMVAGMVTAALAVTTGLVAYGPQVGSAVADRLVCAFGSTDCGRPDDAAATQRPTARVLTQQPGAALGGPYELDGVKTPSSISPGGSGYTYDGKALAFAQCWDRVNELDNLTTVRVQLCTTADGTVYDCRSTQTTVVITFPRSRNRCAPATEDGLPELVACAPDASAAEHCVASTLDSRILADGKTDNYYEDPSLEDLPGYRSYQQACKADLTKCNADLDRGLADLLAKLKAVSAQYAACASALTNTQTELHTITDPVSGAPTLVLRSDNGWVDPDDPALDPATTAAVAYLLTGAIERKVALSTGTKRPAVQVPGMLAMVQAADDTLPDLATPAGLTCQQISDALGHINDGTDDPGDVTGVTDFCAQLAAAGTCSVWGSQPLEEGESGDATTEVGTNGTSLQLTKEAEEAASIDGLIPGRQAVSFDDAVAYCGQRPRSCEKVLSVGVAKAQQNLYATLQGLGLCTSADTCRAFVEGTSEAAGDCPPASGWAAPSGWTALTNRQIVLGVVGVTVCGIMLGGPIGGKIGGPPGAVAGSAITAALVSVGIVLGQLVRTAGQPAADARALAAALVMLNDANERIADLERYQQQFSGTLAGQLHDIESQLPQQTQGFFGRVLNRIWGGHQA